jgi:hypothetical protein
MAEEMLDKSWGAYLSFGVKTETRGFDLVEDSARKYGLTDRHQLARPSKSTGFCRAMTDLERTCKAAIPFLPGSMHLHYTDKKGKAQYGEKNPTISLKIEPVLKVSTDASISYRVNLSHREKQSGPMGHVLTVTFDNGAIWFDHGTDAGAWDEYGDDLEALFRAKIDEFTAPPPAHAREENRGVHSKGGGVRQASNRSLQVSGGDRP